MKRHKRLYFHFSETLKYQLEGLKVSESLGIPQYIAASLRNIGAVYSRIGDLDNAMAYDLQALKLIEDGEPTITLARTYSAIGNNYLNRKEYQTALFDYQKFVETSRPTDNKNDEAQALMSIGDVFREQEQPETARPYYIQALELFQQTSDPNDAHGIPGTREIGACLIASNSFRVFLAG